VGKRRVEKISSIPFAQIRNSDRTLEDKGERDSDGNEGAGERK